MNKALNTDEWLVICTYVATDKTHSYFGKVDRKINQLGSMNACSHMCSDKQTTRSHLNITKIYIWLLVESPEADL